VDARFRSSRQTICLLLFASLAVGWTGLARSELPPCPATPPPYRQLRYDEDYRYLHDQSCLSDPRDAVKYLPFGEEADRYLSLGGELRERYEYFDHFKWGQGAQTKDGFFVQRYMLHADLHLGSGVRLFAQLKSGLENGRSGGPRPPDEDRLDLEQAFLDLSTGTGDRHYLTLRAGRQELEYGSSRIISPREGPNVRQSFDGLRLIWKATAWRVDGFAVRPVETNPGVFDDGPDYGRLLAGFYAVAPFPLLPGGQLDLYLLEFEQRQAKYDRGTADERRRTAGTRLWRRQQPLDYNFEFVYQWGRFGEGNVGAWMLASDTGYTFRLLPTTPRVGLKADMASGDRDPKAKGLGTFNSLFPRGSYFNRMETLGPANIADLHPSLAARVQPKLLVTVDGDFFWRQSVRDGVYGVAGTLIRSGQTSRASYVGSALSSEAAWEVDRHLTFSAAYTRFFAGSFLKESGPGEDVNYFSAWGTFEF